jgi:hypothetical protein
MKKSSLLRLCVEIGNCTRGAVFMVCASPALHAVQYKKRADNYIFPGA